MATHRAHRLRPQLQRLLVAKDTTIQFLRTRVSRLEEENRQLKEENRQLKEENRQLQEDKQKLLDIVCPCTADDLTDE